MYLWHFCVNETCGTGFVLINGVKYMLQELNIRMNDDNWKRDNSLKVIFLLFNYTYNTIWTSVLYTTVT
jgi:hypothetical protein